jgi:hypothetical protein
MRLWGCLERRFDIFPKLLILLSSVLFRACGRGLIVCWGVRENFHLFALIVVNALLNGISSCAGGIQYEDHRCNQACA